MGRLHSASALLLLAPHLLAEDAPSAAVVYLLVGKATASAPSAANARPVATFDWLASGTRIDVARSSRARLALANGDRFELADGAHAVVLDGQLEKAAGVVKRLPSIPDLARLRPLLGSHETQPAAVRVRGDEISNLRPNGDVRVLADAAVLRFEPLVDGASYDVEIEQEGAGLVFRATVAGGRLAVPRGLLKPGERYGWRVAGPGRSGARAQGESELVTLSDAAARARMALHDALAKGGDPSDLALLSEIDRRLGLVSESQDEGKTTLARR